MKTDFIWTETRKICYNTISDMDENGLEWFTTKPTLGNTPQEDWVEYVTGVVNKMRVLCDIREDLWEISKFKNYHLHKGNDPYHQYETRPGDACLWHRITVRLEYRVDLYEHVLYLIEREHHFWPIAKDILRQIFNGNDDVVEKIYYLSRVFDVCTNRPSVQNIQYKYQGFEDD